MKRTHRSDLWCWSQFNADRDLDFNSYLWVRRFGNVAIDPLPLGEHDLDHLEQLGGVSYIVVTNSDHARGVEELSRRYGAEVWGPSGERSTFPIECDRWASDGQEIVPGLKVLQMNGSKTVGELALLLDGNTLITGDLVRAHRGGALNLLPDPKLADKAAALASVRRLEEIGSIDAVLVGDGWPLFSGGTSALGAIIRG